MRSLHYVAFALLVSCGSSEPTTIVISASGFTKDNGKQIQVKAVDPNSNAVHATMSGTVSNGVFSTTLTVDPNTTYRIDLWADSDGDNVCQFGVDDVVSVTQNDIAEGKSATLNLSPTQADSRGCLSFGGGTLKITGSGFTADKVVFAQLLKKNGDKYDKLGPVQSGTTAGGNLTVQFPGAIITQTFYRVDFYVDDNPSNSHCDSSDHVYRVDSDALGSSHAGGELDYMVDGNTATNSAACATFQ